MKKIGFRLLRQMRTGRGIAAFRGVSTQSESSDRTHFGFQEVTPEEKHEKVKDVFSNVAAKYDLMNDAMSAGIHRCWKSIFIEKLNPIPGTKLLDVAGGTGDITFRFMEKILSREGANPKSSATVCDFNEEMLQVGKQRAEKLGYAQRDLIQWVHGDAQKLPFADNSFDVYTIAFGIRNVVDVQKALDESYRVLKPGGMFMCLEFSKVNNPLLEGLYDWYSFNVIPVMGEVLAADWKSYQYLVESIRRFPDQKDFAAMIRSSGYTLVNYDNLTFGVAAIHSGFKRLV